MRETGAGIAHLPLGWVLVRLHRTWLAGVHARGLRAAVARVCRALHIGAHIDVSPLSRNDFPRAIRQLLLTFWDCAA